MNPWSMVWATGLFSVMLANNDDVGTIGISFAEDNLEAEPIVFSVCLCRTNYDGLGAV